MPFCHCLRTNCNKETKRQAERRFFSFLSFHPLSRDGKTLLLPLYKCNFFTLLTLSTFGRELTVQVRSDKSNRDERGRWWEECVCEFFMVTGTTMSRERRNWLENKKKQTITPGDSGETHCPTEAERGICNRCSSAALYFLTLSLSLSATANWHPLASLRSTTHRTEHNTRQHTTTAFVSLTLSLSHFHTTGAVLWLSNFSLWPATHTAVKRPHSQDKTGSTGHLASSYTATCNIHIHIQHAACSIQHAGVKSQDARSHCKLQ